MIKAMRYKVVADPRGKIKSGKKSDRGLPQSLDHFNITAFPELEAAYGKQPKELLLFFPSDELTDVLDTEYNRYGGAKGGGQAGTKIRACDGEVCVHRMDEEVEGVKYVAGQETPCICERLPDDHAKRCKFYCHFKAWIGLPPSGKVSHPLPYLFETGSINSASGVVSCLNDIKLLNYGVLRGVQFKLSVRMVSGRDDVRTKFPIWQMTPVGSVEEMRLRSTKLLSLAGVSRVDPKMLSEVTAESAKLLEYFERQVRESKTDLMLVEVAENAKRQHAAGKLNEGDMQRVAAALANKEAAMLRDS